MEDTVTLFRPTGPQELALVRQSGWKRWPPRPDWQPIFYPVLNEEYAVKITRDWNAKDPATGHRGYVTRFEVRTSFLDRYEVHRVGGRVHDEYWIPAAEVEGVNDNIVGDIEVISIFTGAPPAMVARSYQGPRLFCDFEDDMGSITLGVSLKRDQGITTFCDLDRPPGAVMLSHGEATNRLITWTSGKRGRRFRGSTNSHMDSGRCGGVSRCGTR